MLCDLGADVVKVEPPDGDITRLWGAVRGALPGYFHQQNVGKRDVCIDLRAEGAQALVHELVAQADVLIENYRPDVMPRLGFGYEALAEVNPRLIMLSISGFGHDGPESRRPAYAPVVHAETGQIARQADRSGLPYRDLPLSVADTNASLHGLVGLLAAVIQRATTGRGQHIDIAMVDATVATDDQIHYALEAAEQTGPLQNDIWETGAGPVLLSTDFRLLWRLLMQHHGMVDPTDGDTPLPEKIRLRRDAVDRYMRSLSSWEAVDEVMAAMNIAWGVVRAPEDIRNQATVAARGAIVEVDARDGGTRPVVQSPYRFSAARSGVRGPAPHRGEHNGDVLTEWLGKDAGAIEALHAAGVLLVDEETVGAGP